MTQDVDWTDPECPAARALDLVGDRWSLLIVRDAMDGARAFTEFQRRTGIARNILTDRLTKLAARGVIERRVGPSGRRQEYALTESGRALFPVIVALRQWGEGHAFSTGETHSALVDEHGKAVPALTLSSEDGVRLDIDNTRVDKVH